MDPARICIVGSKGYIGAALHELWPSATGIARKTPYHAVNLKNFDVIIYLGGKGSRTITATEMEQNTTDILDLATQMSPFQTLIYASSAAVYEGCETVASEDNPLFAEETLDFYSQSMLQRERLLSRLPNVSTIGLRLGTVVGWSPRLRSDRVHIEMLKTALFGSFVRVFNPRCLRAILAMSDLLRAMTLLCGADRNKTRGSHAIFNLASFNTSIGAIATCVARLTNAKVTYVSTEVQEKGFSLKIDKFRQMYGFEPCCHSNETIIQEFLQNKQRLVDIWSPPELQNYVCLCCNGRSMVQLIDLGCQPLANHLLKERKQNDDRFPLQVIRCTHCFHHQLTHVVPPARLFSEYVYVSGTADTNRKHFEHFAANVLATFPKAYRGTVLDISSNDGTQLDCFATKNWRTFGVDPARNLSIRTRERGHDIIIGFWGDPRITRELQSKGVVLDVIVAQNVLAHVPSPAAFLTECAKVMQPNTVLFVQTSQAKIFQHAEFDTIYHEHLSFFTVKSMQTLCQRCGLVLVDVAYAPIHGVSYIFTIRKQSSVAKESVTQFLEEERIAIYDQKLPIEYNMRINQTTFLLLEALKRFARDGFSIVGFGAPAKGNTLLSYLSSVSPGTILPEYLVDENPLKQGLFTPNTNIPIVNYGVLQADKRNLVIFVLAWNFLDEVMTKIHKAHKPNQKMVLLVPFPTPSVYVLDEKAGKWRAMTQNGPPKIRTRKTLLVTHFYNEEFLLPFWILHHAPLFDDAILIDYASTDRSREVIKLFAPDSWKIVSSRNAQFDALAVDEEVRDIERSFPDSTFKLALTVTEFLVWPDMHKELEAIRGTAFKLFPKNIVGRDDIKLNPNLPLVQQRCAFTHAELAGGPYTRFMHVNTNALQNFYSVGRHGVHLPSSDVQNAMIFKYLFTPWPETLQRKLQIKSRQSERDKNWGLGIQHQCALSDLLSRREVAQRQIVCDLWTDSWTAACFLESRLLFDFCGLLWSSRV